jgi:hypothetical protein
MGTKRKHALDNHSMDNKKLRLWFKMRHELNIVAIEQSASLPFTTLTLVLDNKRDLPVKHWPALLKVLKKYGYQ